MKKTFYLWVFPIWKTILPNFMTVYGIFALIRDDFLPEKWQNKLKLSGFINMVPWYLWVIAGLLFYFILKTKQIHEALNHKSTLSKQRKMDIKLENEIKERIPFDAKVSISFTSGNLEAHTFANEIYSWMSRNGYHNFLSPEPSGELILDNKPPIVGIRFSSNPKDNTNMIHIGLNDTLDS